MNSSRVEGWYYVPTKLNVADELTRFTGFQDLTNQLIWCTGPEFLTRDNNQLVNINLINEIAEVVEQPTLSASAEDINLSVQTASKINKLTTKEQHNFCANQHNTKPGIQQQHHTRMLINWEYYLSFTELVRHLAWLLKLKSKWIKWKRGSKEKENFKFLTTTEIGKDNSFLPILLCQSQVVSLPNDYKLLSPSKPVPSASKLTSLNPVFKGNLIKVGRRIQHANIAEESKHQTILSKDHPLAQLIIKNIHKANLHTGRELTLAISRK